MPQGRLKEFFWGHGIKIRNENGVNEVEKIIEWLVNVSKRSKGLLDSKFVICYQD